MDEPITEIPKEIATRAMKSTPLATGGRVSDDFDLVGEWLLEAFQHNAGDTGRGIRQAV